MLGETAINTPDDQTSISADQKRIDNAVVTVEDLLGRHEWEAAAAAAANIHRLFPKSAVVIELVKRVKREREPHRRYLKRQFLEAARGDDPERAMELLRDLDKFLTRAEAAPMLDVAHVVIEQVKQNLGQRFTAAVREERWATATQLGDRIITEFANTRMAQEVRDMIDLLRQRAAEQRQLGL